MVQEKLRAVFYARVSTEEERQLNALEKQVQENRDVISNNGWILVGEYIDEGKTGTTTKRRSAYKHLLADMTEGKFDIVVCKDQDRLQRNTLDWYLFVDNLVKNNLKLFMYLDNKFFIPSEDALITGIKAIIAEEYSRNLSKKLNNANRRRVERALAGEEIAAMGNGKSLAFKIVNGKWVKDEKEAELGKKIFELYLEYDSIRKVRDWVNEHGYTNSVGKPFTSESISRILKNEKAKGVIVMGKYHHDFDKKKIVKRSEEELVRIPAPELAYVSEEMFGEVQRRLKAKTGKKRGVNAYSNPLSGKIFCGKCGRKLYKHTSRGYVNWICSSKLTKGDIVCKGSNITTVAIKKIYKRLTDKLEVNREAVKHDMVLWLNELKATLSDKSVNEKIQKDIDTLEGKKSKLLEAYLEDMISKKDYKSKYEEIDEKIKEKEKLLIPVEENEDIKDIEEVIENIDQEIDAYIASLQFEDSKVDFLIEHTKRITVLANGDIIIELDIMAGAIIAGKDFLLYVHESMYITVTETDNGRNSDTAKETKACVAVFYCSVSSQVAGLLFFEGADVHVLSEINSFAVFYNITFGNIDCDEGYIRIGVLLFSDGRSEQVTWHYNNGSTLGNSKIDGVDTLFIGILCRFVILVLYAVCIAVGAYSFPSDLVEGFVGDISGVCDHGNFLTCGVFFFSICGSRSGSCAGGIGACGCVGGRGAVGGTASCECSSCHGGCKQ